MKKTGRWTLTQQYLKLQFVTFYLNYFVVMYAKTYFIVKCTVDELDKFIWICSRGDICFNMFWARVPSVTIQRVSEISRFTATIS